MYQALYRKYRPTTFKEVVGQKIVVKTLTNAIINNKINHAYIFCGPRGTGKTSVAKIFAKTINCQNLKDFIPCNKCDSCSQIIENKTIDIIEIDAASNNGVDEIRELKNNVNLVPSVGKYKVYIIDEVHMLTQSAFNALLKTLEEPPQHVIFILATTEVHKIPETVLSRCQKFEFKKISNNEINEYLKKICDKEQINYSDMAINKITEISNGCMRDALSLLDQINSFSDQNITEEDVDEINGNISHKQMYDIIQKIGNNEFINLIKLFKEYDNNGKNLLVIFNSLIDYLKNLLIYINDSDYFNDNELTEEYEKNLEKIKEENIYSMIDMMLDTIKDMKYGNDKLLLVELCFIKLNSQINCNKKIEKTIDESNKIEKDTKNLVDEELSASDEIIQKIKKVRINNTLSFFNKKDTISFKKELIEKLNQVENIKDSSIISLINDGNLKAKGNEYLLFVYESATMDKLFNSKINEIDKFLSNLFNDNIKAVADNIKSWNSIKNEFNKALKEKKKIYHYINDDDIVIEQKNNEKTIKEDKKNKTIIDNMFDEIVQYK